MDFEALVVYLCKNGSFGRQGPSQRSCFFPTLMMINSTEDIYRVSWFVCAVGSVDMFLIHVFLLSDFPVLNFCLSIKSMKPASSSATRPSQGWTRCAMDPGSSAALGPSIGTQRPAASAERSQANERGTGWICWSKCRTKYRNHKLHVSCCFFLLHFFTISKLLGHFVWDLDLNWKPFQSLSIPECFDNDEAAGSRRSWATTTIQDLHLTHVACSGNGQLRSLGA